MKIVLVVGARPNFMKVAPIHDELTRYPSEFEPFLVHTGQHYDERMSKVFLEDLGLPHPDVYLGVGSGSHAVQTARVMIEFEKILLEQRPDWVVVVGDVNSTMACALDAVKLQIPVAHVEAGLRSRDRSMPEEFNRLVTDSVSDLLLAPSADAARNLRQEGIPEHRIVFVGNVMIDSLRRFERSAENSRVLEELGITSRGYALVTIHRPGNVDEPEQFARVLDILDGVQQRLPVVFPIHPRSRKMLGHHGLIAAAERMPRLKLVEPVGYKDFLKLQKHAAIVLTDSGGIQEETTALGVPCLTLRENTERPITVEEGTNIIVGLDEARILQETERILAGRGKVGRIPEGWDGKAAGRIVHTFRNGAARAALMS